MVPYWTLPAILLAAGSAAFGATDEDALELKATPAVQPAKSSGLRLAVELAAIHGSKPVGSEDGHRAALDLRWADRLAEGWRFGLSSRIDDVNPALPGQRASRAQLREAYVSWQDGGGGRSADVGRVNLRIGPAYGFNPTDVFRQGASRSVVTADPIALRENRTGTFMVRASQLWDGGSASLAWAPQLTTEPLGNKSWTLDLAATNAKNRLLFLTNVKASERWSGEALAMLEQGQRPFLGANVTGLLGNAAVLHGEWAVRREASLLDRALGRNPPQEEYQQRVSAGATYAFSGGLSVTAELGYNGAGLDRGQWRTLFAQGPAPVGGLLLTTQSSQEQTSRRAWLLYATQKGVWTKKLDITAFVRQNLDDHSSLTWAEARYHFDWVDVALQWQRNSSRLGTEFASSPYRQLVQLVARAIF